MSKCGRVCDDKCQWFDGCCMVDWDEVKKIEDEPICPYHSKYCEDYDGNCTDCIIHHL